MWPFVSGLLQHRVHLCCSVNQYFTPLVYKLFNAWVYTTFCLFTHLFIDIWAVSIFWLSRKVNDTVNELWTFMYRILFERLLLVLLSLIPTGGIAWSCGNSMISLLENHQTIFYSGCTILCSQQQCMRVLFVFHSLANICSFPFFLIVI